MAPAGDTRTHQTALGHGCQLPRLGSERAALGRALAVRDCPRSTAPRCLLTLPPSIGMRIKCGDDVYREWLAAIYIFIYIYICACLTGSPFGFLSF